ncbi:hypothetical protein C8J56DRAFT_933904 [Mycena floridula]|nr:hypothetical protein C8J56DRAFT_933904 [Mycena floridula]
MAMSSYTTRTWRTCKGLAIFSLVASVLLSVLLLLSPDEATLRFARRDLLLPRTNLSISNFGNSSKDDVPSGSSFSDSTSIFRQTPSESISRSSTTTTTITSSSFLFIPTPKSRTVDTSSTELERSTRPFQVKPLVSSSSSSVNPTSETVQTTAVSTPSPSPSLRLLGTTTIGQTASSSSSGSSSTATVLPNIVSTTSKGFWANKSAVAGTFVVVSLAIVLLLAGIWTLIMKRKARKYQYDSSGGFATFRDSSLSPEDPSLPSPGPSTDELHHQPPMDPHYYDVTPGFPTYPATTAMPNSPLYDDNLFDPFTPQMVRALTPAALLAADHPYARQTKLAPVSLREPAGRGNVYTPDSFYGAGNFPPTN